MNRVQGSSRQQHEFGCLEDSIGKDNTVRVIAAFADKLGLESLGFVMRQVKVEGRPSFADLCCWAFETVNCLPAPRFINCSNVSIRTVRPLRKNPC
jgi:hypothetical protein